MIKCIAIDMDGTLLNTEHQITEENIDAIKKAQAQGVEVVIATGRSYPEAIYILKEAGITCSVICVNGAEVRSPDGEITDFTPLDKQVGKKALELLENSGMYVEVFTNKGVFTVDIEQGVEIFKNFISQSHKEEDVERIEAILQERVDFIHTVDSFEMIFEDPSFYIYKLLAFSFERNVITKAEHALSDLHGIALSSSGPENLEINGVEAQKGIALDAFTKEKGISLMDTMAIGDNYNDLSMFQRVGRAVAMGNADEEIKGQCHFVTLTNEESGVAKAIMDALK
ncbi:Cof-type HAD-IIB family hydrolase [Robertmurraya andreesenii]|uniref:Cof subfamily protein (Haloacid dehalogenase superfamily) n=1 Tax=Anoxybacillus andreesenii TaxID=1325932 RepID=A0ABT9V0B8_9BACL|nr:Cof-type HAD-IIB family hydrolase [Robertmurraya andreesenii]MDQ0154388.1 Cof subfamily protein (haloacid dehalogenase superfamily) [Robertmurraya andreesenii]